MASRSPGRPDADGLEGRPPRSAAGGDHRPVASSTASTKSVPLADPTTGEEPVEAEEEEEPASAGPVGWSSLW